MSLLFLRQQHLKIENFLKETYDKINHRSDDHTRRRSKPSKDTPEMHKDDEKKKKLNELKKEISNHHSIPNSKLEIRIETQPLLKLLAFWKSPLCKFIIHFVCLRKII